MYVSLLIGRIKGRAITKPNAQCNFGGGGGGPMMPAAAAGRGAPARAAAKGALGRGRGAPDPRAVGPAMPLMFPGFGHGFGAGPGGAAVPNTCRWQLAR